MGNKATENLGNTLVNTSNANYQMLGRMNGYGGTTHINSADGATAGSFFGFVIDQDTVISACTGLDGSGNAVNYVTKFNISGKTLKAGSFFAVKLGEKITSITCSSGALVAYNNFI